MRRTTRSFAAQPLSILAFLASLSLVAPSNAQDIAVAEALFNKGLADMKAGRHETGCKAIAESQRIDPRPGTLFTLATCEAEWGRIATAVTRYGDYLAMYERLPDDKKAAQSERVKVAKAERERLAPDVPQLTLSLPKTAPASTTVKLDGEIMSDAVLGIALPLDPGEHVLSTQPPGGLVSEQRVMLARGEKKQLTLEVKPSEAPPVAQTARTAPTTRAASTSSPGVTATVPSQRVPPPDTSRPVPIWSWITGGAGLVATGAAVGFLVDWAGVKGTIDTDCPDNVCDVSVHDVDEVRSLRARWNRDIMLSVGLGAVGLASLGVAVAGFVRSGVPDRRGTWTIPWVGVASGGMIVGGSF